MNLLLSTLPRHLLDAKLLTDLAECVQSSNNQKCVFMSIIKSLHTTVSGVHSKQNAVYTNMQSPMSQRSAPTTPPPCVPSFSHCFCLFKS